MGAMRWKRYSGPLLLDVEFVDEPAHEHVAAGQEGYGLLDGAGEPVGQVGCGVAHSVVANSAPAVSHQASPTA